MSRIIKCECCGVEFEAKRPETRFCSKKCVCKNWYQNNKEKHQELGKKWIKNNKEKFAAIQKKSREKHIDRVRTTYIKWEKENTERIKAARKKWEKENPEKVKAKHQRYRDKNRKILEPKKCLFCKEEFQPKRSDAELCSTKCIHSQRRKESNPEENRTRNKKWIAENHERHKSNKRAWHHKNKDTINPKQRKAHYKKQNYPEELLEIKELQYQIKKEIKNQLNGENNG